MARKRRGRPINGILILDKPTGVGSNAALQQAKRLFFASKAGHTGSLDPLASGVLPVCFGEATKFSHYLLDADKSYQATIVLGAESSTQDADGDIIMVASPAHLQRDQVANVVAAMQGEQWQTPPMYSAIKHQGQRLYDLARQGKQVEVEARRINVHSIEMTAFRPDCQYQQSGDEQGGRIDALAVLEIDIALTVSKGTYVRTIAADIGKKLGVGGFISSLRRTAVSVFDLANAVSLQHVEQLKQREAYAEMDALLVPVADALPHIPSVTLDQNSSYYLLKGNPVQVPKAPSEGQVKLLLDTGDFVGIGVIDDDGRVAPKRLVVR